jgi:hypothetical protein
MFHILKKNWQEVVCFRGVIFKKDKAALDPTVFTDPCHEEKAQSSGDKGRIDSCRGGVLSVKTNSGYDKSLSLF